MAIKVGMLFAAVLVLTGASYAGEGARAPVVVELFTSEGCSSCPPADALLIQLQQKQPVPGAEIICLGQHVDYWNSLGWKDVFSSAEFTARQQRYSQAFVNGQVYTPQMVVDGRVEFNGSDAGRAASAIARAAQEPKATVLVSTEGTSLQVHVENLPAVSRNDTAEVLLAITESDLLSNVSRGENAGRKLRHIGVVRRIGVIGTVRGPSFDAKPNLALDKEWNRGNLRAVVIVQERGSRRVLGAGSTAIAE
jgi:hypothetical protein